MREIPTRVGISRTSWSQAARQRRRSVRSHLPFPRSPTSGRTMTAIEPLADRLHLATRSSRHRSGFVSSDELARRGFSRSGITRLIDRQLVERVAPGWYRSTSLPWGYDDRVRQAALVAAPDGALAARSALHWFGVGPKPVVICLIGPRSRRPAVGDRRFIHSSDLSAVDTQEHRSVLVTTPARSLIDAARMTTLDELNRLVSEAVAKGLTSEAEVAQRFLELARRGRPGVQSMRKALSTRTDLVGPHATTFEQDLERIIARNGFPKPTRQHRVVCQGYSYKLDHAWPEHRVWSECDSMVAHSSPEQLASDLERQNRIIAETAWRPVRFTYRDVHDRPEYVRDQLACFLPTV